MIEAVHESTYETVTHADGRYILPNVRMGRPYSATATMTGFKTQHQGNIFVKLGEDRVVNFQLQLEPIEET